MWHYYDVRMLGIMERISAEGILSKYLEMRSHSAKIDRPRWGPDDDDWQYVETHQPELFFDILLVFCPPAGDEDWQCLGLHLQVMPARQAHCYCWQYNASVESSFLGWYAGPATVCLLQKADQ